MSDNYDAFDAAMDAEVQTGPRTIFGELDVDVWPTVLVKGQGKIPFDATQHSTDDRRTAIDLTLIPTKGDYNIERHLIAESAEWAKIIKPSLRALNLDLRAIKGRYVQVQLVPTGRTYEDKQTGAVKENTTFKFIAVYDDFESCQKAADEFFASRRNGGANGATAAPTPAAPASNGNGTNGAERDTAAKFLPALVKMAGGDLAKLSDLIASGKFPLVSKYFDISSPEVVSLIS